MFKYNRQKLHKTNPNVADLVVFPEITTIFFIHRDTAGEVIGRSGLGAVLQRKDTTEKNT